MNIFQIFEHLIQKYIAIFMNFITFDFDFLSAIYFENFKNTLKMVKTYNAFRLLVIQIENFIK